MHTRSKIVVLCQVLMLLTTSAHAQQRPNILLIMAEDMSARVGAFGDEVAITPISTVSQVPVFAIRIRSRLPASAHRVVQRIYSLYIRCQLAHSICAPVLLKSHPTGRFHPRILKPIQNYYVAKAITHSRALS